MFLLLSFFLISLSRIHFLRHVTVERLQILYRLLSLLGCINKRFVGLVKLHDHSFSAVIIQSTPDESNVINLVYRKMSERL